MTVAEAMRSLLAETGVEFAEHRQYEPGDEIRHIDWRAFGKTDKYFVKEYEEETNLKAHLLVDASGSMAYKGKHPAKFQYAVPKNSGPGRTLLMALGDLVIGWLLLTHADIALRRLDEIGDAHPDHDFYAGKLSAGRFFAATVLPRLAVERAIAEETTLDLMDLPEGAF